VTYEVLTGEVLFKGKTPMTVMRAHDRGAEVTEEWPIDVPAGVEEVIAQALTRVPAVRYSSISVFLKALEDLQTAAVEQRIADRVNQMLEEMRTALDTGRFEQAVAVGKDLIELKPNHEAGARLLGEAQARLSEKCKLEEHLEEKQTSLEAERKELLSEKSELTDYVAILEKRIGNLSAERAELEAQLKKLKQIQVRSESDKAEMLQSLEAVEKRLIELRKYSERLDAVSRFLTNGDLKHSRQLLKQPRTPNSDLQEVTEKFDKGADTAETSTNSAKQQVEESDEGAIVWVVVALLVIFVTIIVGQAIGTS
jgi:chromosome segregation ATPase